ncbi:MAG: cysteine--tRNA ligase [Mycoplasmataceae bacterium]|nr:cysteine--tRNA ligase [Mycoplasmataceae bacterium]
MKVYDSLSNKRYQLISKHISIYNCGPTVYNDIHIGNARPLITFDVLVRFLKALHFNVLYVHNITDVDDKIINQAKILKVTESEIANTFYHHYLDINKALNILSIEHMPKVSENIPGMIEYIQKLIDAKSAYVTDSGDVYFDVKSVPIYGSLSHQNIDQLQEGVRKEVAVDKKTPLDFVLWKKTESGLNWESPWSVGRPGWHTECALFINKYIGDHATIHGGGIDLKFPHHENENAQNYALFKRNIADLWMHVGHINVNHEKMAKSLGNFVLVKDLLLQHSGNDIRWFMYQSRYQNPLEFTKTTFTQSSDELLKFFQQINQGYIQMYLNNVKIVKSIGVMSQEFINALNDDLNFPEAKVVITSQIKSLASYIKGKKFDKFQKLWSTIKAEFDVLGIVYHSPLDQSQIKSLVDEWQKALKEKNYILSDKYRQQLIDKKVI